jgi:hypothetical protein
VLKRIEASMRYQEIPQRILEPSEFILKRRERRDPLKRIEASML